MPVFVIEGKVRPFLEFSGCVYFRYDKADSVYDGLLVRVQYTFVSTHVNSFDRKLVVRIAYHFANEV